MGIVENVGFAQFPKQGEWLGRRTRVCFRYDTSLTLMGTIVRDDAEAPWLCVISLDDGRVVLATECMHSPEVAVRPVPLRQKSEILEHEDLAARTGESKNPPEPSSPPRPSTE